MRSKELVSDPVKILLTGDFCPMHRSESLARAGDYQKIIGGFLNTLSENDIKVVDLECPLTTSTSKRKKTGPSQKAHPDTAKILSYAGINLVAMSNNHIMDYDNKGISDTMELCKELGIKTIGVGDSPQSASKPFEQEIRGQRITIFNYSDWEFIDTSDCSFMGNPIDPITAYAEISKCKKKSDCVIVIVHAGNEHFNLPSPRIKKLYRYLVDIGADVVVSHHTHVFSGYEVYNSKPIFYGLGNFIYDWPGKRNTSWNRGYTVQLKLSKQIDFEIIPIKQGDDEPGVYHLNSEEKKGFEEEIQRLNGIIQDDVELEAEFLKYCMKVYPMYDAYIEPYFGKIYTALRKRGILPNLMSKKKRLLLLNLTRCESHRDVLMRMLDERTKLK